MIVERIWTGNAYRNYNYLIVCPESGEALAIDPLDHQKCLAAAKEKGWEITQILNTHEHHDHTGGNEAVVAATGAKVIAHHQSGSRIAGVDRGVNPRRRPRTGSPGQQSGPPRAVFPSLDRGQVAAHAGPTEPSLRPAIHQAAPGPSASAE